MQDKNSTRRAAGETELPTPPKDHDRWNEYHEAFGIVVRQAAAEDGSFQLDMMLAAAALFYIHSKEDLTDALDRAPWGKSIKSDVSAIMRAWNSLPDAYRGRWSDQRRRIPGGGDHV